MSVRHIGLLAAFILGAELIGVIGSLFTSASSMTWYMTLAKPALNPPSWVFGPVWTSLYALMGIAAFLVWRRSTKPVVRQALGLFVFQLLLNAIWSPVFFGLQRIDVSLVIIIVLWFLIVATIVRFAAVSRLSAWLLSPYLVWVSFAIYLNYALLLLNS